MNVIEGSNALSFSLASLYWVSKLARLRVKAISKKSKEDDPKAAANPRHPWETCRPWSTDKDPLPAVSVSNKLLLLET